MIKFDDLFKKMDAFWENHPVQEIEDDSGKWFISEGKDYEEIYDLLMDILFVNGGHWNWPNKEMLESNGYHCWIGDGDSFGILVAVVTKDGKSISLG